jgi:hypothetical protein
MQCGQQAFLRLFEAEVGSSPVFVTVAVTVGRR